jgi:hypothetical protein
MRLGWEIPNPVNILQPDPIIRFPLSMIYVAPPVTMYDVTFTVKDTADDPIEGAKVKLGSLQKLTDADGTAVFQLQGKTNVNYRVTAEERSPVKGKVAVDAAAVAVDVVMN